VAADSTVIGADAVIVTEYMLRPCRCRADAGQMPGICMGEYIADAAVQH
jgi:hypothetical protein